MTDRGGRLVFVGLGLHNEDGVTVQGLHEIQAAEIVYAETYTSTLSEGALDRLAARTGKTIELLGREALEDGSRILEECRRKKVALLIAGDPMTATTHVELRLRAIEQGSDTAVIHGVSVMTAVPGLLGLQHYKFGRTVTLPLPQEGYSPTSPYELIAENMSRGLHTLVLLDIHAENKRYMTANEGMHLLLDMERRTAQHAISSETLVCVVARAGSPDCVVRAGPLKEMISIDFGGPLHALVVPGKLHFMESEALRILAGTKD
jgi:diphthine synthase